MSPLELAAYPVYILVALHRNADIGGESAAKYMVQGMVASAISLYGMSFLFGTFGTTYFSAISIPHAARTNPSSTWACCSHSLASSSNSAHSPSTFGHPTHTKSRPIPSSHSSPPFPKSPPSASSAACYPSPCPVAGNRATPKPRSCGQASSQ